MRRGFNLINFKWIFGIVDFVVYTDFSIDFILVDDFSMVFYKNFDSTSEYIDWKRSEYARFKMNWELNLGWAITVTK